MKKLSLFISAFALCSSVSYMAMAADSVNCAQLPSCESLGYRDRLKHCPGRYIVCPFDNQVGTCLHEAAVGSIQFFPFNMAEDASHRGWLLCDGSIYSIDRYPELYEKIGQNFCIQRHGDGEEDENGNVDRCEEISFRVPDYRGYFLRVKGTPRQYKEGSMMGADGKEWNFVDANWTSNNDFVLPQRNELPLGMVKTLGRRNNKEIIGESNGLFSVNYLDTTVGTGLGGSMSYLPKYLATSGTEENNKVYRIELSYGGVVQPSEVTMLNKTTKPNSDSNYADGAASGGTGVIPQNYAVAAYIYAGKIIKNDITYPPPPPGFDSTGEYNSALQTPPAQIKLEPNLQGSVGL